MLPHAREALASVLREVGGELSGLVGLVDGRLSHRGRRT
jgi:hypothetical protein